MSSLTSATFKYATQVIVGNAVFGAACYAVPALLVALKKHSQQANNSFNLKPTLLQDTFEKNRG